MKTVAITGGMGFIGHHLVNHFLEKKWSVIVIDDLSLHTDMHLTKYRMEYIQSKDCKFIQDNCADTHDYVIKLKEANVRHIVHLASIPNQATANRLPNHAVTSIVSNSLNMASLAAVLDAKLVHISSSMVYGNFTQTPQCEQASLSPANLYGLLKAHSEDVVKLICKNYTIIRPSAVYGPGDNCDRVIGRWIKLALEGRNIMIDSPSAMLDFTHVADLVRGIYAATITDNDRNQTYNMTRGQARSLGEAALLINSLCGNRAAVDYSPLNSSGIVRGELDISKARRELTYRPCIDLQEGVAGYVKWMKTYNNAN